MSDEKSGVKGMVERAQDAMGGMAGMAAAATAGSVKAEPFVANAAMGNLYELEAARMALTRSPSERVKALAALLLDDHTTAAHQLRSTLRSIDGAPTPPTEPDDRRARMIDHLREAPDDEFEQRFIEQQILAHQENLTLFEGYAANGDDPRLRLFAQASVPSLQRHLAGVKALGKH